jgi:pimeloyl-ACP methyl ester carboxylesterase
MLKKLSAITLIVSTFATAGCGSDEDSKDDTEGTDDLPALPLEKAPPIVFVHGFAGSAQQFESQAMRFAANGYPADRISAYEHNGGLTSAEESASFTAGTEALVDAARAEFGVEKVILIGHSRGTGVSTAYLENAARAAKIAKYIALDGGSCAAVAASNVPCLEVVQATRADACTNAASPNCFALEGQRHVEVATSAESFARQYEFLVGEPPRVTEIVQQRGPVTISGRAVNFPLNTGRAGSTLEVWEIDTKTGQRATATPLATYTLGEDGAFGPLVVDPDKHYEKVLSAPGSSNHHFYMQPYLRSSKFVRLLSGPSDSPIRENTNRSDNHSAIIAMRMREWTEADRLEVSVKSSAGDRAPVQIISDALVAKPGASPLIGAPIALHIHDAATSPGDSTLAPLDWFVTQAFQTGVDVFMPAQEPPDGTITFTSLPRGDANRPQVLNVPNWASSNHMISLMFSDFPHD